MDFCRRLCGLLITPRCLLLRNQEGRKGVRLSEMQSVLSIYKFTKIGTVSIEHQPLMNKKWLLNSVT